MSAYSQRFFAYFSSTYCKIVRAPVRVRGPEHAPFQLTRQELNYLEKTKVTPALDAGDALLFCNAFFHKSEPVFADSRAAYILRLVPKGAKFSRTRLLALKKLGQNLEVVNPLFEQHFPDASS